MKFAHLADCHIGSWRDPLLEDLSTNAFEKAIKKCIDKEVDFVLISGDLFNTSLPGVDKLKRVTTMLRQLKEKGIKCYIIAGSHDFSPSGKTMLDVLEEAGLCVNVAQGKDSDDGRLLLEFTVDDKTGAKITGLLGKKCGLEKNYYEALDRKSLSDEEGYKIFMFHSLLTELKPKELEKVDSQALSLLPKGFDYYAGGHPHFVHSESYPGYGRIAYPGPLFPNNFKELEELKHGGFYIVDDGRAEFIFVKMHDVEVVYVDATHKSASEVEKELFDSLSERELEDKIVTIRIAGCMEKGKPSDIGFSEIFAAIREKGAYAVLKNSSALSSKEFEEIKVEISNAEEVESKLIDEQIGSGDLEERDARLLAKELIKALDSCKYEGETVSTFEKRIKEEVDEIIGQGF
jgi:hypothetical protein